MLIDVHPRVSCKRPEISEADVSAAFFATVKKHPRVDTSPIEWIGVGFDGRGRLLQYVVIEIGNDHWLVIHTMPATTRVLVELGLKRR